jgi:DNA-directed RNA polymerase subunit RPC12/RpoP
MSTTTEKGSVTMICPSLECSRTVVVAAHLRGKNVRCPHCGTIFRVPAGSSGSAAGPAITAVPQTAVSSEPA